ncbi:MAG: BTAD domain-containing putative transcriptional regulator [Anaerovoracaceae bacterium]|jgi:DNA-binding SARP family transcriptional activator
MNTVDAIKGNSREVNINMLGGFTIEIDDKSVNDNASRSSNVWNLLAYLIIHRDRILTQGELIELLWPDEDTTNPANALKTVLYRTRKTIEPYLGANANLILSQKGSYLWNPLFPCTVDAEIFTQLIKEASNSEAPLKDRMELFGKALSIYKGDFIPKLSTELWAIPLATYYHSMYVEAILTYGELLLTNEDYDELANICSNAIQIEMFDERIHKMLLISLVRQGKINQALKHYNKITEILYRNLGVHPSPELRELYMDIMKEEKALETDLALIQKDLKETVCTAGAFYCEYGVFREVYRLEVRRALRQGTCLHLALITISNRDGSIPSLPLLNRTMDKLIEILPENLRRGDVFCRYSGAQFALLLPSANYENSIMIMERIVDSFQKRLKGHFLKISYTLQPMELDDPCLKV